MAGSTGTVVSLMSKFRGCLMGSHIGDCFGSPFEGDMIVSKSVLTGYFAKMLKDAPEGGTVFAQPYTDDTAMTLSLGNSLADNGVFDPVDMAKRFVEEFYKNPRRGYGANVVDVFRALKNTNYADVYRPAKLQFGGSGSYGNGAAMRIAPVALFCYNESIEVLKEIAKNSSLLTHTHQNGYNGAILQCLAIAQALRMDPSTELNPIQFTDSLLKKMEYVEEIMENVGSLEKPAPYCEALEDIKSIFEKEGSLSPTAVADRLGNYVSAHKSVPTAIYCFLRSLKPLEDFDSDNPFVRAIYFSISVGGDTDTIAAMTGSIAGAYHGQDSIPKNFSLRCEALDESLNLADRLLPS